jgi:micrococcal nuclease
VRLHLPDTNLVAYVLLTLLALWAVADFIAPFYGPAETGCRVGYVYDGDTVELLCGAQRLTARLQGFDTPETKEPRCAAEAALGHAATLRLRALLRGTTPQIYRHGHDKYGRDLVTLLLDGQNVGETLIAEGLAHRYSGGTRAGWCEV